MDEQMNRANLLPRKASALITCPVDREVLLVWETSIARD